MCQEAYDPSAPPKLLGTPFWAWSRFTCREGSNRFETFDFEALRWLQLHIRNASRPVIVRQVGVRRRLFDWANEPRVVCAEPALQRLFDANRNTIENSTWETCSGDNCRERQQYSGDGGHQLHVIREVFGEPRATQRFLRTFSEGLSKEGYFMDCWPAVDRRFRVMQREIDAPFGAPCWTTGWASISTAGTTTGRPATWQRWRNPIRGCCDLPTIWIRFATRTGCCRSRIWACPPYGSTTAASNSSGTNNVLSISTPRRCSNMCWLPWPGLAAICGGRASWQHAGRRCGRRWSSVFGIHSAGCSSITCLGSPKKKGPRLHDRTLATAVLFDQCPGENTTAAVRALVECPREMGQSYPCNACWRDWALARLGRADVVLGELRRRWATMDSVLLNNTLQEGWKMPPGSAGDWSHCPAAPLDLLFRDIAGIAPRLPVCAMSDSPAIGRSGRPGANRSHAAGVHRLCRKEAGRWASRYGYRSGRLPGGTAAAPRPKRFPAAPAARPSPGTETVPTGVGKRKYVGGRAVSDAPASRSLRPK